MHCLTYGYNPQRLRWFAADTTAPQMRGKYLEVTELQLPAGGKIPLAAVRAQPLFLENWTFTEGPLKGKTSNVVFIATSDNTVVAYLEEELLKGNDMCLWQMKLGLPTDIGEGKFCSNIPGPIGICGTPVIDPQFRRMFVVALIDDGKMTQNCLDKNDVIHLYGGLTYFIYALDVDTGVVTQQDPLLDRGALGRPTFDANRQDQRGGLNLINGRIYATFADLFAGDAGEYYGWVVSINTLDLNDQWFFPVCRRVNGGGIWGPGGAAADLDLGLYIATGNSPDAGSGDDQYWGALPDGLHPGDVSDFFEGVVRLDPAFGGRAWLPEAKVSGVGTSAHPALAEFNGALYMVWKGAEDDTGIWSSDFVDGKGWAGQQNVHGVGTSDGPALAVFNGELYMAWKGIPGDDGIYFSHSADGTNWAPQQNVPHVGTSDGPALAVFNGELYMAWKGAEDDTGIWSSHYDGTHPWATQQNVNGVGTSAHPALAVFNGELYTAWKGIPGDDGIYFSHSADGTNWAPQQNVPGVGTSSGPALATLEGGLYLAWKGVGGDTGIWFSSSFDGENWASQQLVPLVGSSDGPALAVFDGVLFAAWKGIPGDGGIYFSAFAPTPAIDWYQPHDAQNLSDQDLDIGGSSPIVLPDINGWQLLAVSGKDGDVYLLDRVKLGHWGNSLSRRHVYYHDNDTNRPGGSKCAPAYFRSDAGEDLIYFVGGGQPGLIAFRVDTSGAKPTLVEVWRAGGTGITLGDGPGSPVVASALDGSAVVWIVDDNEQPPAVRAFDALTGTEFYNSNIVSTDNIVANGVPNFAPIICGGNSVFVGTNEGFACYHLIFP